MRDESLKRFYTISGKITSSFADQLKSYDINNPESETYLEHCQWEYFHSKNSYQNCFSKDSDYYIPLKTKYNLDDLKESIKALLSKDNNREYDTYLNLMDKNYEQIKEDALSIDDKKGCILALAYYTGNNNNSERINKNVNILIRGENSFTKEEKWNDGKIIYPELYYLYKCLANLPFYNGYTMRCVNLDDDITSEYKIGTVITWLRFNSSLVGKNPSPFLAKRNTIFYIYSINGREIPNFSYYSSEKEVLYSPFSHFLVFKKEYKNGQNLIHMRQIEIGLHINNIIYMSEHIFRKSESNLLIQEASSMKLDLKIIPKISTDCVLAFLKSFRDFMTNRNAKYKIVLEIYRFSKSRDQKNAGKIVKYIQDNNLDNIEIEIITFKASDIDDIKFDFFKLGVNMNNNITFTCSSKTLLEFLISE